jgi:hypothetical protein
VITINEGQEHQRIRDEINVAVMELLDLWNDIDPEYGYTPEQQGELVRLGLRIGELRNKLEGM